MSENINTEDQTPIIETNYSELPFEISGNSFSPTKIGGLYPTDGDIQPTKE